MNMSKDLLNVAIVFALVASAGCVTRDVYRPDGEVISGRTGETTAYELDAALEGLMTAMRSHPAFIRNYDEIAAKKKGKPILQVLPVDCRKCITGRPDQRKVDMLRDKVCQSVFESDQFALRDAVWSEAVKETATPDCVLHGSLTKVSEDRHRVICRLQLVLTEATTSAVIWQGAATVVKLDWLFR